MKIPRDVSGSELVRSLKVLGYRTIRQRGSHISIATAVNGSHKEVIPNHSPIKTGTLASTLKSISIHHGMSVEELLGKLEI